ncbi:unnamed protein product [Rotaria magnacalcarata]|uniref:EGF-like domain-containing protein n=1 Tax=Rotaria magnacalcarata TaxID=392030 RepID=A0A8S3G2D5_9BILA|nr:unnamed protein product [Rotaria magnacalcarata]
MPTLFSKYGQSIGNLESPRAGQRKCELAHLYYDELRAMDGCGQIQCVNGGVCYENLPGLSISAYCLCKNGYTGKFCEIEYFQCQGNGRFPDLHNCARGKYFECIHYDNDGSNPYGVLLSRNCPATLRFNVFTDQCDYSANVQCI